MTDKDLSLLRSVPNEITKYRIQELKNKLKETDYQAIKFAEGQISEEDFAPIRTQRQLWRDKGNMSEFTYIMDILMDEINELERILSDNSK